MGLFRTLVSIAVVIVHSGPFFGLYLTGGTIALKMLYIISGFYMTLVLNTKYNFKGSYFVFIGNRFLRLFPVYIVVLILTFVCFALFYYCKDIVISPFDVWRDNSLSFMATLSYIFSAIFFIGQDWIMFLGVDQVSGSFYPTTNFYNCNLAGYEFLIIPQAWTLGIEMTFYLIAPFIVRRKVRYILILALLSLLLKFILKKFFDLDNDPWNLRFSPNELSLFLLGALSYKFYCFLKTKGDRYLNNATCLFAWAFTIAVMFSYRELPHPQLPYKLYDLVSVLVAVTIPFIFHFTKKMEYDQLIGKLSYPIYMSHWIVIICLKECHIELITKNIGIFTVFSTIIVSVGLWLLIDEPIDKFRQLIITKQKALRG
ncbi:MAG: acyltransferase family protein [Candidatus Anammoxibacter sp.]